MNKVKPKVFLSHASEDKERFAIPLAESLEERGIDVWLDKWEMLPGDRLVKKIFREGIDEADVFIIVLSENSINKPWVREELDAGLIKRIEEKYKIIPIVIDDCSVPLELRSTYYVKVKNAILSGEEVNSIVDAIFDNRREKEIGDAPSYTDIIPIQELSQIDTVILQTSCELSLKKGHSFLDTSELIEEIMEYDIPEELIYESLEIQDEFGLIEGSRTLDSRGISFFKITPYGFEIYANNFIENFDEVIRDVVSVAINEELNDKSEIANKLNLSEALIYHILLILEHKGYLRTQQYMGGNMDIVKISPSLKRALRNSSTKLDI